MPINDEKDAIRLLNSFPNFKQELKSLISILKDRLNIKTELIKIDEESEIEIYGCYNFDEVMLTLKNKISRGNQISGVINFDKKKIQALFVTINKSDKDYSPSTLYKDYSIDQFHFHWQTQNRVSPDTAEGRKYIDQATNDWRFLLFIRYSRENSYKMTNSYYCIGFVDLQSYEREKPINIVWKLREPMPGFLYEKTKVI